MNRIEISEEQMSGGQEDRLVNLPSPVGLCRAKRLSIVLREVFLGKSEACAIEKGVRRTEGVISDDRRAGCQEGFSEGRKLGGQEDRPVKAAKLVGTPSPDGEGRDGVIFAANNEILQNPQNDTALSPYSPIALSSLNIKKLDCFAHARNDVKNYIVKALSPYSPIALSPLNNKKLDCFANARNDVKNSIVKVLSPYSPIAISPSNKKAAFTLAEVLITLGVIGVVAAISLPRFIDNMTERANSERQANIAQKVTQAMEQMRAHGLLNTSYPTTEAFVDELQNYLKITKRCDKDHIADCWPTKTVTAGDGTEEKISRIKTGKNLQLQTETNNVGLVLADGAQIILNYNPDAKILDIGDKITSKKIELPVGSGKSKEFIYTSDVTNSIDFIMDVNGGKKPNSEMVDNKMNDIRSFNQAKIKGCIGVEISGIGCAFYLSNYYAINTCNDTTWDNSGTLNNYCSNNLWAGMKMGCSKIGMELPSKSDLSKLYNKKNSYPEFFRSGYHYSSTESTSRPYNAAYIVNLSDGGSADRLKYADGINVLCLGK